jgi:hypothetical protein
MFKRTRKTTPKKKSSKKVKKYQAGGDLRSGLINTTGGNIGTLLPNVMPMFPSFPGGGGGGGATGHIENIQNSANQAVGELGRARDAIGGGNNIFGPVAFARDSLLQSDSGGMKKGGKVKKMKAGGRVRGAGKAQKGVRACKMR